MKAVVMSIKGDRAAVLAMDGVYYNIRNKDYEVGQPIEYEPENKAGAKIVRFARLRAAKLAAAVAAVVFLAGGYAANAYAYSTVTLDLNPSLRYELNFFDRVIDFDSYNEDGEDIVSAVGSSVLGRDIDTAIEATLDALDDADYIGEETPVIVTVDSHFLRNEKLEKKTQVRMEAWNEEQAQRHESKSISGESVVVTDDMRIKARDQKISPGRVIMMEGHPDEEKQEKALELLPENAEPKEGHPAESPAEPDLGMNGSPGEPLTQPDPEQDGHPGEPVSQLEPEQDGHPEKPVSQPGPETDRLTEEPGPESGVPQENREDEREKAFTEGNDGGRPGQDPLDPRGQKQQDMMQAPPGLDNNPDADKQNGGMWQMLEQNGGSDADATPFFPEINTGDGTAPAPPEQSRGQDGHGGDENRPAEQPSGFGGPGEGGRGNP